MPVAWARDALLESASAAPARAPETLLRSVVATAYAPMLQRLLSSRYTLALRVEGDATTVLADPDAMEQVVLNLVTNAVKYTSAGGAVSLGLSDQGDTVTVTVGDTGIGIAAGDLEHIFDRFWRADPARSREGESPGTGLGLAITKWVAEAHGGSIAVQSRPGRGTLFTVALPRLSPPQVSVT